MDRTSSAETETEQPPLAPPSPPLLLLPPPPPLLPLAAAAVAVAVAAAEEEEEEGAVAAAAAEEEEEAAGLVGEWMWAVRRASREGRILSVLGLNEGCGTASVEGDAAPVTCGATATAAGSGARLLRVAPEGSAAVGWRRPRLDTDDDAHCSGGVERVGESEASASFGSRIKGRAASDGSLRLLLRLPSLVDGRGTTRTPGGEAPHTASFSLEGVAQAVPWVTRRRVLGFSDGGSGYPVGADAPGSSMSSQRDSSSSLEMLGILDRRTSSGFIPFL